MENIPKRITVDDLHKLVAGFPEEIRNDEGGRTAVLAQSVIRHFLGLDWFKAHIRHDAPKLGFLNYDFSSDAARERTTFRIVELAESLFNLQHIEGFDACISQMKGGGEKIQSICAELDFGRFLYIHDIKFRFVVPQMTKGTDYDVELFMPDGLAVPADAKCKFETTEINPTSVHNSLEKARKQLPADRAGMIFVKVPQRWIVEPGVAAAMEAAARDFLRRTDRVVAVTFYVSHLETRDGVVLHRHAFREVDNPASIYHQGRKWELFTDYYVPPSWNGMPPKWQRFFLFPKDGSGGTQPAPGLTAEAAK